MAQSDLDTNNHVISDVFNRVNPQDTANKRTLDAEVLKEIIANNKIFAVGCCKLWPKTILLTKCKYLEFCKNTVAWPELEKH